MIILSRIILIYCTVYKAAFACRQDAYAAGQATKAIRNCGQSVEISTSRSAMVRRQCFKGQIPSIYHASGFFCMFFSLVDAAVQLGCRRPRINIHPLHIICKYFAQHGMQLSNLRTYRQTGRLGRCTQEPLSRQRCSLHLPVSEHFNSSKWRCKCGKWPLTA